MHFLLHLKEAVFFSSFAFFLHLSCLHFPCIVAIHEHICVTCTILNGGGGGAANAFICIFSFALHPLQSQFACLNLHPPPDGFPPGAPLRHPVFLLACHMRPSLPANVGSSLVRSSLRACACSAVSASGRGPLHCRRRFYNLSILQTLFQNRSAARARARSISHSRRCLHD